MQNLYTVWQIRALESLAMEHGISSYEMMQRAAQAALNFISTQWPQATSLAIFCGSGNNGGDGYSLANLATQSGLKVYVYQVGSEKKLTEDSRTAYLECIEQSVEIYPFNETHTINADLYVDALLGIGSQGEVREPYLSAINFINKIEAPKLALDVPSGVDADTGKILGAAVKVNYTLTFIGIKQGLLTGEAVDYTGKVICDNLAIPPTCFTNLQPGAQIISYQDFLSYLPSRKKSGHKGDFGHVLILGGFPGYSGAAILAAIAALRAGAGLVSVATHPQHAALLNIYQPEIMVHAINTKDELNSLIKHATVLAIGPGLAQTEWSQQFWKTALTSDLPLVIDADGLNLLAKNSQKKSNWVLTPHPGEAGRLLGKTTAEIQADRFTAVKQIQQQYGGVCVLKGAGSLIATNKEILKICIDGNPGMASGGMGDVLTGVIAGLIAQKLPLEIAAYTGVCAHAKAGDLAATNGERGVLASDLFLHLRQLVNS